MTEEPAWQALTPKVAPKLDQITAVEVLQWFDEVLDRDVSKPSIECCDQLATEINFLSSSFFTVDVRAELLSRIGDAAICLERAIEDFEKFESGPWSGTFAGFLADLPELTYLGERHQKVGRPPQKWHKFARPLAALIIRALRTTTYAKSLNAKRSESAVAAIGVLAAIRAFRLEKDMQASGFSQALIWRDRSASQKTSIICKPNPT